MSSDVPETDEPENGAHPQEALPKHKLRVPRARRGAMRLWVGTRKGLFSIDVDEAREDFAEPEPHWIGATVFHAVADPRDRDAVVAALRTPSGVPTVVTSRDGGRSWAECAESPRFAVDHPVEVNAAEGATAPGIWWERTVNQVFWLTPGHASEYGTWYAGSSPQGLFRSEDQGITWEPMEGLHGHPEFDEWTAAGSDETPDGPKLHSVVIDPRDADHLVLAMSTGGVLESFDAGVTWERLDGGLIGPEAREPYALAMGVTNPDRLWMQSHFGVYRMDLEERIWQRVGDSQGERPDAGFPIAVHPADPDIAWTVPMDGSEAWTRMPKDGRPTVRKTTDGGQTWTSHSAGFPKERCWWTVKRQCLAVDGYDPLGVYIGTSTGEIWFSRDEGENWRCVARGLPHIYSVEVG